MGKAPPAEADSPPRPTDREAWVKLEFDEASRSKAMLLDVVTPPVRAERAISSARRCELVGAPCADDAAGTFNWRTDR